MVITGGVVTIVKSILTIADGISEIIGRLVSLKVESKSHFGSAATRQERLAIHSLDEPFESLVHVQLFTTCQNRYEGSVPTYLHSTPSQKPLFATYEESSFPSMEGQFEWENDSGYASGEVTPFPGEPTELELQASKSISNSLSQLVNFKSEHSLDGLFLQFKTESSKVLGFPVNQQYDYTSLFRFLHFSLNNVGNPFGPNRYRLNTYEKEREVINIFARLTGGNQDIWGYTTSGGTEGNIYGLHLARELLPDGIVYYSSESHYSISKALKLLRIPGIEVISQPSGEMNYDDFEKHLSQNQHLPAIVLANIGTTMKGAVDNLLLIQRTLTKLSIARHYIHCDAALSGMILPFVDTAEPFGFNAGADSLSISGHKMIGSPLPCGVVLTKREHLVSISSITLSPSSSDVEYAGVHDTTLLGSRSGFTPLILWHALTSEQVDLPSQVRRALEMAEYAVSQLQARGVPAWRHDNSVTVVFPCPRKDILNKWQLAPQGDIAHLITMPSVTREQIDAFVEDYSL